MVGSGVDSETGLFFGVCHPVAMQLTGPDIKVLAFEAVREEFLAVFATPQ